LISDIKLRGSTSCATIVYALGTFLEIAKIRRVTLIANELIIPFFIAILPRRMIRRILLCPLASRRDDRNRQSNSHCYRSIGYSATVKLFRNRLPRDGVERCLRLKPRKGVFCVRALLDQGSTFSFISESLCQTLRTRCQRAHLWIRCFGEQYSGAARSRVLISVSPVGSDEPSFALTAYVYQKITSYAASVIKPLDSWPHLRGLNLADPDPASKHPFTDADLYGSLLLGEVR